MNILITLPGNLIECLISGEKPYEMRKVYPKYMKVGVDGFFVVEKGTDSIRCWCRVDKVLETYIDHYNAEWFAARLCVTDDYVQKYAGSEKVFLWKIGKVITFDSLKRDSLYVDRNPQQYAYCPLSDGESF